MANRIRPDTERQQQMDYEAAQPARRARETRKANLGAISGTFGKGNNAGGAKAQTYKPRGGGAKSR